MLTLDDVAIRIRSMVRGGLLDDVPIESASSLDDLGLSSLQVAEVVFSIEDDLGIELDEQRAADIRHVGGLVDLVNDALLA